jgi:hypothetical protein
MSVIDSCLNRHIIAYGVESIALKSGQDTDQSGDARACQTSEWMTARNLPQSLQLPDIARL